MNRRPFLATLLAALLSGATASANDLLSSPAIDASLFREGAIRNFERGFDEWTARCQEIAALKRRVCNLLSRVYDKAGAVRGFALLAADDRGAPTLMIALATPIMVAEPLTLKTEFLAKAKAKATRVAYRKQVWPMFCESRCKYVLAADPAVTFSLNEGNPVSLAVKTAEGDPRLALSPAGRIGEAALVVRGTGFAQALQASLGAWPTPAP